MIDMEISREIGYYDRVPLKCGTTVRVSYQFGLSSLMLNKMFLSYLISTISIN